jgi:hypothetical protein
MADKRKVEGRGSKVNWVSSISSLRALGLSLRPVSPAGWKRGRWPEIDEYKKIVLIILSDLK